MNENAKAVNFNFQINAALNHTTSHLLAAAVLSLYKNVKLGFGPATSEGFYYDFEFDQALSNSDLLKIEKRMHKLANQNLQMHEVSENSYSFVEQPYKKELYDQFSLEKRKITYYSLQNQKNEDVFVDLCAGGHIPETKSIKYFKLISLAGAFWRGNSDNKQLTRIYGTAWDTQGELDNYLKVLEERKERDHRRLGKALKLFTFSPAFGQGFHSWLPKGMVIKNRIKKLILELDKKYGFQEVYTPPFGEQSLYQTSGHLAHYRDDMFSPIVTDKEKLIPRPMTCPHHITLFNQERHSYREFPIRTSEQSILFRYEKSGALTGLERVRSFELTEGHVFIRHDQIGSEIRHLLKYIHEVLDIFNIEIDYVSLSLRDENKSKYFDNPMMWEQAEKALQKVLDELQIKYTIVKGEAAFYGPKIDFQVKTVLNHEITISTLQLDFLLPEKFSSYYINENEEKISPILIHRGLIGTYERFISILLEQTKANLPFWLAPNQFVIIPISDKHLDYAQKITTSLKQAQYEVYLDARKMTISKKIREAQMKKTKYQIIIGDHEMENNSVSIRKYGEEITSEMSLESLLHLCQKLVANYQ